MPYYIGDFNIIDKNNSEKIFGSMIYNNKINYIKTINSFDFSIKNNIARSIISDTNCSYSFVKDKPNIDKNQYYISGNINKIDFYYSNVNMGTQGKFLLFYGDDNNTGKSTENIVFDIDYNINDIKYSFKKSIQSDYKTRLKDIAVLTYFDLELMLSVDVSSNKEKIAYLSYEANGTRVEGINLGATQLLQIQEYKNNKIENNISVFSNIASGYFFANNRFFPRISIIVFPGTLPYMTKSEIKETFEKCTTQKVDSLRAGKLANIGAGMCGKNFENYEYFDLIFKYTTPVGIFQILNNELSNDIAHNIR